MSVKEHYAHLLGDRYEWMVGDTAALVPLMEQRFLDMGIQQGSGKKALDLGCGPGAQAQALHKLGYKVTAVDIHPPFIEGLPSHVRGVTGDLLEFLEQETQNQNLICILGDTLSHLPSSNAVQSLIQESSRLLPKEGLLLLAWRDLSQAPKDTARFLPVKSDSARIQTCFLEDQGPTVRVTDLFHEQENGQWTLRASSYTKLKLSPIWLESLLLKAGFHTQKMDTQRGMIWLLAQKD